MTIEYTAIGGIIGIGGALVILLVERFFRRRDQRQELKGRLKEVELECDGNLRIIGQSKTELLIPLREDAYNSLKISGKFAGLAATNYDLASKIEEIYASILDINESIQHHHRFLLLMEEPLPVPKGTFMEIRKKELEVIIVSKKESLIPKIRELKHKLQIKDYEGGSRSISGISRGD